MAATPPTAAPSTVVLRDGSTVTIRPARAGDAPAVARFQAGLTVESRYFRFFTAGVRPDVLARRLEQGEQTGERILLALTGDESEVVAHASYSPLTSEPGAAEMAMAVLDRMQGRGLGTLLVGQLADLASRAGITTFEAVVLADNRQMLEVLTESGFPLTRQVDGGEVRVRFPTRLGAATLERFEQREEVATSESIRPILRPRSVAVVGASRSRSTVGGTIFHNLIADGFQGPVYPVNPNAPVIQSVVAYPSVAAIGKPVDLAVVVVPPAAVPASVDDCIASGVRALVVVTSGFGESGEEGAREQAELLRRCRAAGVRLVGPNGLGVIATDPEVRLNATFGPPMPIAGNVGFLSQSGGLGLAAMAAAAELGIGISDFVSVGNKADVSGNDLLQWWADDPGTDVILLYLESFGNPRKFARVARRVARRKPVVAVKSGRSAAGSRAASSHTGALLAAADVTVDALFEQAGVLRADTLDELLEIASVLASQPAPGGPRVAVVTNVGGPGIMCVDALEAAGLQAPPLPDSLRAALRAAVPTAASDVNPVDLRADATPEAFEQAIRTVGQSGAVDSLVVIFTPTLGTSTEAVAAGLARAADDLPSTLTVTGVFLGAGPLAEIRRMTGSVPVFGFPEDAARSLAAVARYGAWRRTPVGEVPHLEGIDDAAARAVAEKALADGGGWLEPGPLLTLLRAYGLPVVDGDLAATPDEAGRIASRLESRVAIKAYGPGIVHKTELGAVEIGLAGGDTVRDAAVRIEHRLQEAGLHAEEFWVQKMADSGVEMLVGLARDPTFGPLLACGAGGTNAEVLGDVQARITPLTDRDAADMLSRLRTRPLLDGWRGAPATDVGALQELLLRVSALAEGVPEIEEMDLNPVICTPGGVCVVDARVKVAPAGPRPLLGAR